MRTFSALFCGAVCFLFLGVSESSAASCSANPNNLVVNCGFETGTFLGWTLTGNDVPSELNNLYGVEGTDPIDNIAPHSGSYQAYIGDLASNATTLSQTVSTQAGKAYYISFDLANDTLGTTAYPNTLSVMFDGVSLYSVTNVPVEGYTQYTFGGAAVAATTTFSITLGNSLGEFLLDDVSVTLAPEPATWSLAAGALLALFVLGRKKLAA
jgi:hypothetical protein